MKISIRKATQEDMEFITDGIIHAEMSGSTKLPYQTLFGLNEEETQTLIHHVIEEEIDGQEWYLPNFSILEIDGQPASCLSSWVEGENGSGSGLLKAQAMGWILKEKWTNAAQQLECLKSMQLARIQGALQLECIYTKKEYRGKGMASKLIENCIEEALTTPKKPNLAEIQLLGNNEAAMRSYTKCGFLLREQATSSHPEILTLLAHHTRVSLIRNL
jgi:GNAT superfamily N-acetyltransferase